MPRRLCKRAREQTSVARGCGRISEFDLESLSQTWASYRAPVETVTSEPHNGPSLICVTSHALFVRECSVARLCSLYPPRSTHSPAKPLRM